MVFWKYALRHWRGELPLLTSLVIVGVIQIAWSIAIAWLILRLFPEPNDPYWRLISIIIYELLAQSVFLAWIVGTVRSALRSARTGTTKMGAAAAIAVVGLFLAVDCSSFYLGTLRRVSSTVKQIAKWGEWSPGVVELNRREKKINITGNLTDEVAVAFEKLLRVNTDVRVVRLEGPGGSVIAGRKVRELVRGNDLDTFVLSECDSSCVIAFLGGERRVIKASARLGFHKPTLFGKEAESITREEKEELRRLGASENFIRRAYESDSYDVWFPTVSELKDNNIVTDVLPNP
jgi:hypothetical protein